MNAFVDELADEFNVSITKHDGSLGVKSSYWTDTNGILTGLYLYEIGLKSLDRLRPIAEHLKMLSLSEENTITSIETIGDFKGLEKLTLSLECVSSLRGIENLTNLEWLRIFFFEHGFEEIVQLSSLRELRISGEEITSTDGLKELKNLERLVLFGVEDMDVICGIKHLQHLDLRNNGLKTISGLEKFPNLVNLNLFSNRIKEIQGLEGLHQLQTLSLSSTDITEIKGLENLVNLETLGLSLNSIPRITGLETLSKLRVLDLSDYLGESYTPLTEIEGIDHLSNLEDLILTGQRITELKNLPKENLKLVELAWNRIESIDYECLNALQQPCNINLTGNPVEIIPEKIPEHVTIIKDAAKV